MAAAGKLIWTGVVCCAIALLVNLFPRAAFDLGADPDGVRIIFGFGVFLIVAAIFAGGKGAGGKAPGGAQCPHDCDH